MFYKFSKIHNFESLTERELKEFTSPVDKYCITEKIDGSNISVTFNFDEYNSKKNIEIYTRNGNYFSEEIVDIISLDLSKLYRYLKDKYSDANKAAVMFGELYGKKVMNRLDYGVDCDVAVFYFMLINEHNESIKLPIETTDEIVQRSGCSFKVVPIYKIVHTNSIYQNTSEFMAIKDACILPYQSIIAANNKLAKPCNIEGYVIYSLNALNQIVGMAKVKDEAFKDTVKTVKKEQVSELKQLNSSFNDEYFTLNRIFDTISKYGYNVSNKDIGKIIKDVILDAKEDFYKNNEKQIEQLRKALDKQIYKVDPANIDKISSCVKSRIENIEQERQSCCTID